MSCNPYPNPTPLHTLCVRIAQILQTLNNLNASVATLQQTFESTTPVTSSITITKPGRYYVLTPGVVLTFPSIWTTPGDVEIWDMTQSIHPNISLAGAIANPGPGGIYLTNPGGSLVASWLSAFSSFFVK